MYIDVRRIQERERERERERRAVIRCFQDFSLGPAVIYKRSARKMKIFASMILLDDASILRVCVLWHERGRTSIDPRAFNFHVNLGRKGGGRHPLYVHTLLRFFLAAMQLASPLPSISFYRFCDCSCVVNSSRALFVFSAFIKRLGQREREREREGENALLARCAFEERAERIKRSAAAVACSRRS